MVLTEHFYNFIGTYLSVRCNVFNLVVTKNIHYGAVVKSARFALWLDVRVRSSLKAEDFSLQFYIHVQFNMHGMICDRSSNSQSNSKGSLSRRSRITKYRRMELYLSIRKKVVVHFHIQSTFGNLFRSVLEVIKILGDFQCHLKLHWNERKIRLY